MQAELLVQVVVVREASTGLRQRVLNRRMGVELRRSVVEHEVDRRGQIHTVPGRDDHEPVAVPQVD